MCLLTWVKLHRDSFGRGVREATKSTGWKNFWRQGAMKRRRDRQTSLSWLMVDCLPSGLNHDLWLTAGGRGKGGKEGGLEWELHKTSSSLGDFSSHSLMIKNRGSVFSLHTMPCFFFPPTLRLVCNLLYMLAWNAQSTTAWEVAPGWKQKKENVSWWSCCQSAVSRYRVHKTALNLTLQLPRIYSRSGGIQKSMFRFL